MDFSRRKQAFTLLEVIIVIIVIGVLASLALPRLGVMIEGAYVAEAVATIGQLRAAVERCYLIKGGTYKGCSAQHALGWETLGFDGNPADAPGSHFNYIVARFGAAVDLGDGFVICAGREGDVDPYNGGEEYGICFAYNQELTPAPSGINGFAVTYIKDEKFKWACTDSKLEKFLPRTQ